jgi:hypothetical protein
VPTNKPTPTGFTQAVNSSANQPINPDIDDRRDPSLLGKVSNAFGYGGMVLGQKWDELKREVSGNNSGSDAPPTGIAQQPSSADTSFYNPAIDASRQIPVPPHVVLPQGYKLSSSPSVAPVAPKPKAKGLSVKQVKAMAATLNPSK